MIQMDVIMRRLGDNAEAIRALLQQLSDEQARWKPDPETWSMQEVMGHVYNEERLDFRKHLKEMLSNPPQPWGKFNPEEYVSVEGCRQALKGFLSEREASLEWLRVAVAQKAIDWNTTSQTPFGPEGNLLVLSAGDVLVSWVEHDFLHLRQMIELLHAWNEKQASPYSVQYGGGW
jgi:hypothetical protein